MFLDRDYELTRNSRCVLMLQENSKATPKVEVDNDLSDSDKAPLVSVIIPSRNSELTIADCLRSITSQSYRPIEIFVVDSFSTDLTKTMAQNMGAFVISHSSERSIAKNLGAKFARGKYLYFVDADQKLGPDVIAACVKAVGRCHGLLIADQDLPGSSKVSRLVASRRRVLSYDPLNVSPRFVRKDVFDRLGGFDLDLYAGEDLDFHRRFSINGFKTSYTRAMTWHLGSPVDFRGLMNRSIFYSSNYLRYASKYPLITLKQVNPLRVVSAWKRDDARSCDLLPVILLGFLQITFLMISILLNLNTRESTLKSLQG